MLKAHARALRALLLAAAFALPMAAVAQAPAQTPGNQSAGELGKSTPTTAPTRDAGKVPAAPQVTPDAPKVASPPVPGKGSTAVPGWNNPPAWGTASEQRQYASVPGVDTNILIQGAGREWRAFRNGPLTQVGGWVLVGMLAVLLLLYLVKGPFRLHGRPTGRLIERFNAVERVSHWTVAITFVILALSGIVMFFGKHIILPWLGYTGFAWLTQISKNLHNFIGPLFVFAILVMFLVYVKDNLWREGDLAWTLRFGGMLGNKGEMPSGRFNGIEKLWFWFGLVILGVTLSVTGLILDFPNWNQGREAMQQSNVIHLVAATLFIAGGLAHAYMGIFTEGAYRGMRDGYVDETWAREHHSLWYEEVKAGRRPEKFVSGAQPVAGDD